MKVFEKILKICIGRKIKVNYGRCPGSRGISKCSLTGYLLAHDSLCVVMGVPDVKSGLKGIVVIKKNEIESIEIEDMELILDIWELLSGESDGAGN